MSWRSAKLAGLGMKERDVGEWVPVGEIAMLQVQRVKLVRDKQYYPEHIAECDRLRLTPDGVYGLAGGAWILDKHHRHYPDSIRWNENRAISVGFTSHYREMWDLFRETPMGAAGENIIVVADERVLPEQIVGGVRVEAESTVFELSSPAIAEPCVGFTRYMTERRNAGPSEIDPERQKLRNGLRGYAMGLQGLDYVELAVGDKLSIRTA